MLCDRVWDLLKEECLEYVQQTLRNERLGFLVIIALLCLGWALSKCLGNKIS